jgi:hypothetical protein
VPTVAAMQVEQDPLVPLYLSVFALGVLLQLE